MQGGGIVIEAVVMKTTTSKTGRVVRRTTAAQREALIQEYHASGLGRREFAQRKGINLLTFHCWFSKRLKKPVEKSQSAKFVKVAVPDTPASTIAVVAESPSGLRVRIEGLGIHQVAVLLSEVGAC